MCASSRVTYSSDSLGKLIQRSCLSKCDSSSPSAISENLLYDRTCDFSGLTTDLFKHDVCVNESCKWLLGIHKRAPWAATFAEKSRWGSSWVASSQRGLIHHSTTLNFILEKWKTWMSCPLQVWDQREDSTYKGSV